MAIGERLKQARLAAGLSQRQLCGDTITRNMLSQIENGTARPSMDTLKILAQRLEKPVSYFLEEEKSPEQTALEQGRLRLWENDPEGALKALERCHGEAQEYHYLKALCCLRLAETAVEQGRLPYATALLEDCAAAGSKTVYFTGELENRRRILLTKTSPEAGEMLLPEAVLMDEELLTRAQVALAGQKGEQAGRLLDAVQNRGNSAWYMLRGRAALLMEDDRLAAEFFHQAEAAGDKTAYRYLEQCYQKLEDYKMAYYYACKQK